MLEISLKEDTTATFNFSLLIVKLITYLLI